MKFADKDSRICASVSTTTPYELRGERGNDTRGKRNDVGVTVQEEHDGPEEDRSDPEGRGAHGPARPDVRSSWERRARTNSSMDVASDAAREGSGALGGRVTSGFLHSGDA